MKTYIFVIKKRIAGIDADFWKCPECGHEFRLTKDRRGSNEPCYKCAEIFILDARKDLFGYELKLDSLKPSQNRFIDKRIKELNPIQEQGEINKDNDLMNIYQEAIGRRDKDIIITAQGNSANERGIAIPFNKFTEVKPVEEESKEDN